MNLMPSLRSHTVSPSSGESTMPACVGRSDLFERPEERHYRFGVVHDTGRYLRLLSTYSSHRVLDERTWERLFAAVAQLIDGEYGGRVVEGYRSELYVARRH
jgi:hypothetical protein